MRYRKIIMAVLFSLLIGPLSSQSFDSAFEQMKNAISEGNHTNLANLFSDSVDLTLGDTEGIYSKTQAKGVLKNFFEKDSPKSFQIKHQGSSNDGTVYAIGLYISENESFRVYVLFKEKQGDAKIVQLQIEEEL